MLLNFVGRGLWHTLKLFLIALPVAEDLVVDMELLELHLVLGQGACFVAEHEFDLPEFFNEV